MIYHFFPFSPFFIKRFKKIRFSPIVSINFHGLRISCVTSIGIIVGFFYINQKKEKLKRKSYKKKIGVNNLNGGIYLMVETIFEGTIKGTAITPARHSYGSRGYDMVRGTTIICFTISVDENIPDIPSEFPVVGVTSKHRYSAFATLINKGDRILVNGRILKNKIEIWNEEIVIMIAEHIFNENTKFGF